MSKKRNQKRSKREADWIEAKRKCSLNEDDIRKARELGLNPRSLIKNIPSKNQPWKTPVEDWINNLYRKEQEKAAEKKRSHEEAGISSGQPTEVESEQEREKTAKQSLFQREGHDSESSASPETEDNILYFPDKSASDEVEGPFFPYDSMLEWEKDEVPGEEEIARQNELLIMREKEFRLAAEYVVEAFSLFYEVEKIVLFGSVAKPLKKEVPRFREYRRAGIELWHECKDVDLAVWIADLECLPRLRKSLVQALKRLLEEKDIGVADHQVEVFVLEPGSNKYLGNLCRFNTCPKGKFKLECLVPGCGSTSFLRLHEDFTFRPDSIDPARSLLLFERR